MKKLVTVILISMGWVFTGSLYAYDICIDEIYYNLNNSEAYVTNNNQPSCYTGKVVIPSSIEVDNKIYTVTTILPSAFENCTSLTDVEIPESVVKIGNNAFANCTSLPIYERIYYAGTCLVKPSECSVTGTYIIKEGTRFISNYAFKERICISNISIPASVEYIGKGAFNMCQFLKTVTLNSNAVIDSLAFSESPSIKTIIIHSENAPVIKEEEGTFDEDVYKSADIHVATGTKSQYLTEYGWRKFSSFIDDVDVSGIKNISWNNNNIGTIYNLEGVRLNAPQRGVNIIKYKGGGSYKYIVP